jgi:hypothetical protein
MRKRFKMVKNEADMENQMEEVPVDEETNQLLQARKSSAVDVERDM